jgi:mono/diheme cytochrome c family protein
MRKGVLALGLLIGALVGRTAAAGAQVRPHDSEWRAPADARKRASPLTNRSETEAGGARLYAVRCSTCHGPDGRGSRHAPDLTRDVQAQSDGTLFWKISSGNTRAGMPGFSFLPELQRWQLVQHLRHIGSLREHSGPNASRRGPLFVLGATRAADSYFFSGSSVTIT